MTSDQERARVIVGRARAWAEDGLVTPEAGHEIAARFTSEWNEQRLLVRLVLFALTSAGMLAFFGLCFALDLPKPGIFVALFAIPLAEYLIRRRRWLGTGVEEALWFGGLLAVISALPSSGRPEAALVVGGAGALAGVRVRNPLFGAFAAVFVVWYCERRFDLGVVAGVLTAMVAALALLRRWRRPSNEWLWIALVVVLPLAGRFMADEKWWKTTIALYLAFGIAVLVLAVVRRHHALFLAGAIGLAIAAVEIAEHIVARPEAKLAAGGAFLLIAAYAISHGLRNRTKGLVALPVRLTALDEVIEIAGAIATAHHGQPAQSHPEAPTRPEGDGGFGGAGATGEL